MSSGTAPAAGVIAVASVPGPPLLLPGMTGGVVAEVEQLRSACLAAVGAVVAAAPDRIVLVGGVQAADGHPALFERVGRSLLEAAGWPGVIDIEPIAADAPAADCVATGVRLAELTDRVGLIVVADGSARRSVKAPGYLDERAVPFDEQLVAALRAADAEALAGLDPALAADLLVAGRSAWQVLAALLAAGPDRYLAVEHYVGDPFGVLYPVFSYRRVR